MKRCPECRRDYYDGTLLYCLDDGTALVEGPASSDEPATAILSGQSAGERTQVFAPLPPPSVTQGNSIAVLSFVNMSADADNEYFCDGLAEELLNALAKIDDLKVAARTSSFSFKDKKTDIGEIGRKLGVAHVLEGSVRKSGDRLRIAVQLLNASDGYTLWSETYDREMRDIFDVQDEITLAVIDALKLKLLGSAKTSLLERPTENTEAYKAYLKGRYLRYAKNDHRGAAAAFEEAVRLDPAHAPSWLGVAETCVLQAHYGLIDSREACSKVRAALATARMIQGETAEALYIEGFAAFIERDWAACRTAYRRSTDLDPTNSRALGTFGVISCVLGNVDEALTLLERAREADPLAAYPYAMAGTGLVAARRFEDALPFFEQAFAFEKDQTLALWSFAEAKIALGDFDEGIAAAERGAAISGRGPFFLGLLGWALAVAGRASESREILDEIRNRQFGSALLPEACLLGVLGERDRAFELLTRAAEECAPVAYYLGLPRFDWFRDDPRFVTFAEYLGVPNWKQ